MTKGKKKNLSKAKNHFSQVGRLVKNGFDEALKDFSKNIFSFCFKTILLLIIRFLVDLFK